MYFVEGYDKDNDVYETYYETEDFNKAKEIATVLDKLAMEDKLIRYITDDFISNLTIIKEPIDWVQVVDESGNVVFFNRKE